MSDYFTFAKTASIEALTELLCTSYDGAESCERINESTKQACERVNPLKIITPALTVFSWWQLINSINEYYKEQKSLQDEKNDLEDNLRITKPKYHELIKKEFGNTNKIKLIEQILSYNALKTKDLDTGTIEILKSLKFNLIKQKQLWNDNKHSIALNIGKTITLTLVSAVQTCISLGALSIALPYIFLGVYTGEIVKSACEARSLHKEINKEINEEIKKEKITKRNGKTLNSLTTAVITVSSVIALATPAGLLAMSILSAASLTIIGANLTRKAYLNSSSVRNKNYLTQLIFGKEQKKPQTNNIHLISKINAI